MDGNNNPNKDNEKKEEPSLNPADSGGQTGSNINAPSKSSSDPVSVLPTTDPANTGSSTNSLSMPEPSPTPVAEPVKDINMSVNLPTQSTVEPGSSPGSVDMPKPDKTQLSPPKVTPEPISEEPKEPTPDISSVKPQAVGVETTAKETVNADPNDNQVEPIEVKTDQSIAPDQQASSIDQAEPAGQSLDSQSKADSGQAANPPPWVNPESDKKDPVNQDIAPGTGGSAPPTPPDGTPPKEQPGKAADSSGVKKSPFRIIIPVVLILILLGVISFVLIKFVFPRLNSDKGDQTTPSKDESISLTYWGLWEPEEAWQEILSDYQAENPNVKIIYQQSSHQDYRERLQSTLVQNTVGPDIFRYHSTWLPMLAADLSPIESGDIDLEEYWPIYQEDLVKNGSLYGLPLMFDGLALLYNTQMLKNAGLQVPSTWEELQKTAQDLTVYDDKNRIQTAGVALGTASNVDNFSDILALMMLQNNADLAEPTDELASDALTFYTLFNTRDYVWDESLPDSTYAFAIGKVAMIFAPSWRVHEIKNINPDLEFKAAPVPQLPDSKVSWASYWVEGISQASEHKAEASNFLAYLSKDEVLKKLYNQQSQNRLFGEIYPKISLAEDLKDDPYLGAYIAQVPDAVSWYMASNTHDNGVNDKIIKYYENAVNSIVQDGEDANEILSTTAQGVSQILSTYQIPTK